MITMLIHILLVLIVLGLILWAIDMLIPMDPTIRNIIRVVIAIVGLLYILRVFGVA